MSDSDIRDGAEENVLHRKEGGARYGGAFAELSPRVLFPSGASEAYRYLAEYERATDAVGDIRAIIEIISGSLPPDEYLEVGSGVLISRGARVAKSAYIEGPAIIMSGAEIRHSAYIRGSALIGRGAVVGNSSEVKNSILFDGAKAPHFNYVGDSILGCGAHLGAGAVTSNLRLDGGEVYIRLGGERIPTGARKLGAVIGDGAEIGCGAVLNPGSIIASGAVIYPNASVTGFIAAREKRKI